MEIDMPAFDYIFDEVPLTLGTDHEFTARGEIEIYYTCGRGDASVGEGPRYVEVEPDQELTVILTDENGDDVMEITVDWKDPIYHAFMKERMDDIYQAAVDEAWGPRW